MLHTRLETKAWGRTTRPGQVTRGLSEPRPMSVPCLVPAPRSCNPSTSGCACHSAHSQVLGRTCHIHGRMAARADAGRCTPGWTCCLLIISAGRAGGHGHNVCGGSRLDPEMPMY